MRIPSHSWISAQILPYGPLLVSLLFLAARFSSRILDSSASAAAAHVVESDGLDALQCSHFFDDSIDPYLLIGLLCFDPHVLHLFFGEIGWEWVGVSGSVITWHLFARDMLNFELE